MAGLTFTLTLKASDFVGAAITNYLPDTSLSPTRINVEVASPVRKYSWNTATGIVEHDGNCQEMDNSAVAWLGAHWQEVVQRFPNRWILIANQQVVADADNPSDLGARAAQMAINRPFITKIGGAPATWRTAYGG
jgi:hypothetical protein